MRFFALTSVLILFLVTEGTAQIVSQSKSVPGYDDVKMILEDNCIMCHTGPKAPKGLRLDSIENLLKGSESRPVVEPRNPENSELVRRVRGVSTPRMPLSGPPWLEESEMRLIEDWIRNGAEVRDTKTSPPLSTSPRLSLPDESLSRVTYKDIAPIFSMNCIKCHNNKGLMGPAPEKLILANYEAIMFGTERAFVVPGNPEASELIRKIRGQSLPRMPFDGPPYLVADQIALIEKWVAQGAMDERGVKAEIPVGRKVRLHGRLTSLRSLDKLKLDDVRSSDLKKRASEGHYVEVRGRVTGDGGVAVGRIKELTPSPRRGEDGDQEIKERRER